MLSLKHKKAVGIDIANLPPPPEVVHCGKSPPSFVMSLPPTSSKKKKKKKRGKHHRQKSREKIKYVKVDPKLFYKNEEMIINKV